MIELKRFAGLSATVVVPSGGDVVHIKSTTSSYKAIGINWGHLMLSNLKEISKFAT